MYANPSGNGTDVWMGTLVTPRHGGPSKAYSYTYNWTWAAGILTSARIALTR